MIGNFLAKLKGGADALVNKALSSSDKDVMEAMVAAAALTAYADGDCSEEEVTVTLNILGSNTSLEVFGTEPIDLFNKYCDLIEKSKRTAKHQLMKEITDLKGDKENSIRVLIMAIEVADADNNIDEDEMKFLNTIAKELDLKVSDYI